MFSRGNCDTQRQLLGRYFFAASYQTFCSVLLSPSLLQCCPTGSKVCPTFNKIDDRIPVFPLIISRHFFTNNNAVKIYLSGQKLSLRHRHGFSTPFIQSYEDGGKKRAALGRKCSGKHWLARLTKCVLCSFDLEYKYVDCVNRTAAIAYIATFFHICSVISLFPLLTVTCIYQPFSLSSR